jgi:sugar O-acyltransferase (sialic acid O-acetyltransferase NeuD family)
MTKKILIAGTGGFSKEVLGIIMDLGRYDDVLGFIEPDDILKIKFFPNQVLGKPIFPYSSIDPTKHCVVIGIGDSKIREKITSQLPAKIEYISLIHPTAVISKWTEIGEGAIICAGTIITCDIKIGKHSQFNLNTTIGHDCSIGDYFTSAPNVNISGNCKIEDHVYFGTSSCIKQGVFVCQNVIIGMGAIVTKDIITPGIYIGNPAKLMVK